ncbi:unnamed protein product [Rotaria sordida]|uniref:Uncharacterized protein n=1 Tax=Rotaria sordida TaxID=392033 RepID=A0A815K0U5_9BILA|nr:unnamed protein product [Rotaria sordida]CAF1386535.1 unnamed protein product [Rotaria sordida]CAF4083294.1 unnamed protein product [Rotaria sordida]CAF4214015.1 unnamed protein product [Rotaria sordida]
METTEQFSELTDNDKVVFDVWKPLIVKKLRDSFPSIPADFEIKPISARRTHACNVFYDFTVALPDGKFAKVSFNGNAGYVMGTKTREPTIDDVEVHIE